MPSSTAKKSAKAAAKDAAETIKREATGAARESAEATKRAAEEAADVARDSAAEAADDAADAVRDAGRNFDPDPLVSQAADHIASNLSRAADAVRSTDFHGVHQEIAGFARRNPLLFFGGAAVLGFATARMFKASEAADHEVETAQYSGSRGNVEEASWGYAK